MLLAASAVLIGCQPKGLSSPVAGNRTVQSATAAELTPAGLHVNTAADVQAAKAALTKAVPDGRLRTSLTRAPAEELTPRDWWDTHKAIPYKIVVFVADAPKNANYLYTVFTLVQSETGAPWALFKTEQGTG
jgi:hypothetical protein